MEDGSLGVPSLVPHLLKRQLDPSSSDPFFGSNGLDYFWQKSHLISFLSVIHNLKAFSICSYDIRQEAGVKQLDLPSSDIFFWCPEGFICSSSSAECLKIDEYYYYPQDYLSFDFRQNLFLLSITVVSIIAVKFFYSLLQYFNGPNDAVLFHRPRRRNTPLDTLIYWVSYKFFKMKVRWKGLQLPIQQLQTEDLIAVLRKMESGPTVRFMMTCKAANEFCTKYKSRITVPEANLKFKYKLRILT